MGIVKALTKFAYKGKAYNVLVSSVNESVAWKRNLFDGMVAPDYPVYNNGGFVQPVSELAAGTIVLDRHNVLWKVESLLEYDVDEDFQQVEFTDGRVVKCSLKHKFPVISPKKVCASDLAAGDSVADTSIGHIGKYVRKSKE